MRRRFPLAIALVGCIAFARADRALSQSRPHADSAALQRILQIEDARATGSDGAGPLIAYLGSSDTLLRRIAIRALGRLQRPDLVIHVAPTTNNPSLDLLPLLHDPVPAIRGEAANAIAQGVSRATRRPNDSLQPAVRAAASALRLALATERNDEVAGIIATAIGRLPYADTVESREAISAILARAQADHAPGFVDALYELSTIRASTPASIVYLKSAATPPAEAASRRLAVEALGNLNALDSATVVAAFRDHDEQVRRLALVGAKGLSPDLRRKLVQAAFADPSQIVRVGAVAAARAGAQRPACAPILAATRDHSDHVALTAIDALGSPCADTTMVIAALLGTIEHPDRAKAPGHSWQRRAHAIVALAKIDSARAAPFVATLATTSPPSAARVFAANAATASRNVAVLQTLAQDPDNNVRATAIAGLSRLVHHQADPEFIAALHSHGNQVVLEAATALRGSTSPAALPAILDAFDSLSAERRENARDPRVMLLTRIGEMGSLGTSTRLTRYLADFDTTIATNTAVILTKWSGSAVEAHPQPLAPRGEPLAALYFTQGIMLRVTMSDSSGGGTFTILLDPADAPATVARIVELARAHYYDGHVFQRVEPNFVVQGGGPDASEYVGDSLFMRDELTGRSHARGTIGISSRGRDTGDAQWFINLADNPRLDHLYTVFGAVTNGLDVVDRILEGDIIARVEVIGAPSW
jgi:cyclophilin family peptidyl-prolyl cis-trans isomerase/HEAT repeat protein